MGPVKSLKIHSPVAREKSGSLPFLLEERPAFGNQDIRHAFCLCGFPSLFTRTQLPERDFQEWIDAYWAKDIQEMFSVGKRSSFQKFAELLLAYSGGQFEATRYAGRCEISRATAANYFPAVLQETFVVQVVRPFSGHKPSEIVLMPRVYGFDNRLRLLRQRVAENSVRQISDFSGSTVF